MFLNRPSLGAALFRFAQYGRVAALFRFAQYGRVAALFRFAQYGLLRALCARCAARIRARFFVLRRQENADWRIEADRLLLINSHRSADEQLKSRFRITKRARIVVIEQIRTANVCRKMLYSVVDLRVERKNIAEPCAL